MSSLVLEFSSSLVYDHLHGSNFYKMVFLKSFKVYKMVLKFKIVFERQKLKDWSCCNSKCVFELIKINFQKTDLKSLKKDWIEQVLLDSVDGLVIDQFDRLFVKFPS